jgi:hypothetical protein
MGFNVTSAPGSDGASRTQIIGYLGGGALLVLSLLEWFRPELLDIVQDPTESISVALGLLGLGFLRRAMRR